MGLYSSDPVDPYTASQKAADQTAISGAQKTNTTLANDWNTYATSFNSTLLGDNSDSENPITGLSTQADNYYNSIFGMDLGDISNEDMFNNLFSQGQQLQTQYNTLDLRDAPTLTTSLPGTTSVLTVPGLPSLSNLNTSLYKDTGSDITNALNQLKTLQNDWNAEEKRYDLFGDNLNSDIAGFSTLLGQLNLGSTNQINQLEQQLAQTRSQIQNFSSPILAQLGGTGSFLDSLAALDAGIADLRGQQDAERSRISNFESGLLNAADSFGSQASTLTIRDEQALKDILTGIEEQLRGANRFSSEMGFDFSQEAGDLQLVRQKVMDLLNQRSAELNRVNNFENTTRTQARDLARLIGNASIYSADNIDQYGGLIDDLLYNVSNFNSDLNPDLTGLDPQMADLEAAYQALKDRRAAAIDPFMEQLSTLNADVSGLGLTDETGRGDKLSEINKLLGQLGIYSGGRADDARAQANALLEQIQTQTGQLTDRRNEISTTAEDLLAQITSGSYFNEDQVGAARSKYDDLLAQINEFGATGAQDEASQILDFLNGQTNRLQKDEQARLAAQERDQALARAMLGQAPVVEAIRNSTASNYLTDAQILALVSALQGQDEGIRNYLTGTFSQAMGA